MAVSERCSAATPVARRAAEAMLEPPGEMRQVREAPVERDVADRAPGDRRVLQVARRTVEAAIHHIAGECGAGPLEQFMDVALADADRGSDGGNAEAGFTQPAVHGTTQREPRRLRKAR